MVITLDPELESLVNEQARQQGVPAETLALNALRAHFSRLKLLEPRDEWERRLRSIGVDCGVALSNWAVSSQGIYD